ncbi:MAG: hypothetical protein G01um101433_106 [Parcubacteria group bacterium Gr01-1014_33]|nr:MAG: hypothetical protein G01um101433_106 [Parcubacteria group bacterium Gr01-1014_33]
MNQYGKKPFFGRIKKSLIFHIVLAGLAGALFYGFVHILLQAAFLYRASDSVDQNIRALSQKKGELEASIKELETNEALERNAKESLGLKKPGEEVVVVVPGKKNSENVLSPEPRTGVWERIKQFLLSL